MKIRKPMPCAFALSDGASLHEPMTLITAIKTASSAILAADSLSFLVDRESGDNQSFVKSKLQPVTGTDWIMASAGNATFDTLREELTSEVAIGKRQPFDPHLNVGGPVFLRELAARARKEGLEGKCWIALAGLDIKKQPLILAANPPDPNYFIVPDILCLGAQSLTATWILRLLWRSCPTNKDLAKLSSFVIWQMSKQEIKIGNLQSGYPIHTCTIVPGSPPLPEEMDRAALGEWMYEWEKILQGCFLQAISRIE